MYYINTYMYTYIVLALVVFAYIRTWVQITPSPPKLAETAEMWQCNVSCLALVFGRFAFFILLAAKPFPLLPNIKTEPDHTHSNRNNASTHTNTICAHKHKYVCDSVTVA